MGNKNETHEYVTDEILYIETLQKLRGLLNQLPAMRRKVFEMSREKSMSYKEISKLLSLFTKTAENHTNLALKFIRPYFNVVFVLMSWNFYN